MMKRILEFSKALPAYALKPWFPYLIAWVAFSDYFIFVVPLDAVIVASFVIAKKRWFSLSFWATLGSTLGAILFAALIQHFGVSLLERWAPEMLSNPMVQDLTQWLQTYGALALVGIAAIPISQHPTVMVAALAKVSLVTIFVTMFVGRFIRCCIYAWLTTHAKNGLSRFFKE